ncbi:hypothetical protein ACIOC1_09510 [Streptomyces sp. NPDC088197]|uniref:hypothetical protein n=1 Tax=unclassified Streptomyces TaxID=2593676 RepID=UPI0033B67775
MHKLSRTAKGTMVTGAAMAAALGLAVSPASAVTYTVSGSSSTGAITATATTPTLTDTTTGTKLTCTSSAATATVTNGSHGGTLGTINTVSWNTCKVGGITFSVAAQGTPWTLTGTAATTSAGVTTGTLTGVKATLSGLCNATFADPSGVGNGATLNATYTNSTHTLAITGGTLKAYNVSGLCLGLINNNDLATYSAGYVVTPTTLKVVSP